MNVATLTGQFSLQGGQAQERSPALASFPLRGEEQDCFVVLELQPRIDAEFCHQLVDILRQSLKSPSRSLTARFLTGIEGCHQYLKVLNESKVGWRAGLSCAVYHRGEVWLAQAGPAFGCLFTAHGITCVSSQEAAEGEVVWLGEVEKPTVSFHHYSVRPGDALLLVSPVLDKLVPREALVALRGVPRVEILPTVYQWVTSVPHVSALLIHVEEQRSWQRAISLTRRVAGALGGALGSAFAPKDDAGRNVPRSAPPPQEPKQVPKRVLPQGLPSLRLGGQLSYLPRGLRLPLFIIALSLALMLGAMLAWYVPSYLRKQSDARQVQALERAEQLRQQALRLKDEGEARRRLTEVMALVTQLEQERPRDPQLLSLRERLSQDLAKLGAVVELADLAPLADVTPLEGGPPRLKRVMVLGNAAYLWDEGRGQIYQVETEGKKGSLTPLLIRSEISEAKTPGKPVALLLMPAGGIRPEAGVLMLDQARALWEVVPGRGLRGLFLRGTQLWAEAKGLAGFSGNLYVLDAVGRQVWRYLPTDSGYDSEPRALLAGGELPDLIDLALDGQIYLLSGAGGLYRVVGGEVVALELKGLDKPLSQPSQVFTNAATKYLYVLDTGNRRIVVLAKDGRFIRQLWTNLVRPPQGIFVDEGKGRIYLVEGGRLYGGKLPQ